MKIANSYRLREKLLGRSAWMGHYFQRNNGRFQKRYELRIRMRSLKAQYRFFLSKWRDSIMFFQVGRFYEFYDGQAQRAGRLLELRQLELRRGFQSQCGFPVRLRKIYLERLMRLGFRVQVIEEGDRWLYGVKKRSLAEAWI